MSLPPALLIVPAPPSDAETLSGPARLALAGRKLGRLFDKAVGAATVIAVLAVISAIPLLNLLSLGYLLEVSARVARSGRFRDGWIGLERFAVFGKVVLAAWLLFLPARLVHSFWSDAELIAAGSGSATGLRALLVLLSLGAGLHLYWALIRGGKWRHFLWPAPLRLLRWLGAGIDWRKLSAAARDGLRQLRLWHFFRLGALGFAGALLWLSFPVLILMTASGFANPGISFLSSLLGSILLGVSVLYLPFLQTRFALTGSFSEFLAPLAARRSFRKAPQAFWLALATTLLFALPLYLLKIELTPAEVAWLPNLMFVLFVFPARMLLGWSLARAERRETPRIWVSRWAARLAALPVVAVYVFVVWFSQYLTWHGSLGLFEQHAFLVPAPLLGL